VKGLNRTALLAALLALAGPLAAAAHAQASAPANQPDTIIDIRVEGNVRMSAPAVLAGVKSRLGQPYSEQLAIQDEQSLVKTHRFASVRALKTQTDRGIILTFQVAELAVLEAVRLEGVKSLKEKDVRDLVTLNPGDAIDSLLIDNAIRNIQTKYRSEGYYFVQVSADPAALAQKNALVLRVVEGPRSFIRQISFQGNQALSAARLKEAVTSKKRQWPFVTGAIDVDAIEHDVAALTGLYRDEGFLDAQVASAPLAFSNDKRRGELVFVIDEGPRYRLRQVSFEGNLVYAPQEIRKCIQSSAGLFFNGTTLRADLDRIKKAYGEIGYINAEVSARTPYAPASATQGVPGAGPQIDIVFVINEGRQYSLGAIDIRGNRITRENVIRRQLQIYPGQPYNTLAAEESQHRLSETQLFSKVTITPYGNAPDTRNALVSLEEAETGRFTIGAGINSNTGLVGTIIYQERNFEFRWPTSDDLKQGRAFRGSGQTFSILLEPGLDQSNARIEWFEPYLFDKPYSLGLAGYGFTATRDGYDETRVGVNASLGHRFFNGWYGEIAQRAELVDVGNVDDDAAKDIRDVEGGNLILGTKVSLIRDRTDSRWLPSKGDRLDLSYEQVYGSFFFGKAQADYHRYWTLYTDELERKHILAARGSVGDIIGDAPVFERFYGGGFGSLRGFEFRGISPRQGPDQNAIGGNFSFFAGSEYTFPLVGKMLRGALFLDSGTIEPGASVSNYRVSIGAGIRLHLPFFGPIPMSLDFGIPIMKADGDQTQIVSFNVGWVF
jgi:outer membrane protein insertion porin family